MKILFNLFLLLLLTSCSNKQPLTEYNPGTDFRTFKSFTVCDTDYEMGPKNKQYDNEESRAIINKMITEKLESFGYIYDEISPDLLVSYELKYEDVVLKYTECRGKNEYEFWEGCRLVEYPFTEGTMVVSMLDNSFDQVIWIGSMEDAWTAEKEKKFQKQIKIFVDELFEDFPLN